MRVICFAILPWHRAFAGVLKDWYSIQSFPSSVFDSSFILSLINSGETPDSCRDTVVRERISRQLCHSLVGRSWPTIGDGQDALDQMFVDLDAAGVRFVPNIVSKFQHLGLH